MNVEDDDQIEDFDDTDEFELMLEDSRETARKKRNARAYEIRRHLEDLQEQRRFQELYEDPN